MDVQQIASRITSRTKAIMVVHIYGLPCDMDPILALAKKHELKIIEDAAQSVYWVFGLVLKDSVSFDAREAMKKLSALKIGTRPFFWPIHEQPVLKRMGLFAKERLPVSERLSRRGFYLPSGVGLTEKQVDKVVSALKQVLE